MNLLKFRVTTASRVRGRAVPTLAVEANGDADKNLQKHASQKPTQIPKLDLTLSFFSHTQTHKRTKSRVQATCPVFLVLLSVSIVQHA